jgi:pimeloyl-ACP methyl ester carboxylesterase
MAHLCAIFFVDWFYTSGYSSRVFIYGSPFTMKLSTLFFFITALLAVNTSFFAYSQSIEAEFDKFDKIYQQQLGSTQGCHTPELNVFRVCSAALRNDGNAPFILHHNKVTPKVVVLFHGLSDSPFYLRSIAKALYQQGNNVVVGLLPGHGKKQADEDMQDANLADRWRQHLAEVVKLSANLGENVYLGGFSTGGTVATEYALLHPDEIKGLILFSGALALDSSVESMAKIWGIQWLAEWLDGDYQTSGDNPYKYPRVAKFAAFELTEIIFSIRELIEQGNVPNLPIFVAHSVVDKTIPIVGVKNLMKANQGVNVFFEISKEHNVCHADVVISQTQFSEVEYKASVSEEVRPCRTPSVNPIHSEMLESLLTFLATN